MGPHRAAIQFSQRCHEVDAYRVTLYGSLAATGRGHMTDKAICSILEPIAPTEIRWEPRIVLPYHPNGMKFEGIKGGKTVDEWTIFSIGGGALANEETTKDASDIYPLTKMDDIIGWCNTTGCSFWEYVERCEGQEVWDYLSKIWKSMKDTIERGLNREGVLPGGLGVQRKAANYMVKAMGHLPSVQSKGKVYSYALATAEENAAGGIVVSAPTCGSSGVLPAVLYHLANDHHFSEERIIRALGTAGLFGNVVKENGSISGAEVGCQGEVGVACAMAAAAACQLFGGMISQIEYAAEMALEHHLGLTCDPMCGLVQIPCIERNAIAAARALDACTYATFSDGRHKIGFDRVVSVMKETGHDIPSLYKETAEGGLAKLITPEQSRHEEAVDKMVPHKRRNS